MARKVISQTQAVGWASVQSVLDECCTTKNSLLCLGPIHHHSGYLARPLVEYEEGHADLGATQDSIDPESRFALQNQARAEAKKAFVRMDTSKRVQRALWRNAKPIPYDYTVGDIVTFRRDKGGKTVWSPASRVIGREGSEGQDVWLLCENVPALVSAQNLRPATHTEALAHQVVNDEPVIPDAVARGNQEFEDHRGIEAEPLAPEEPVEDDDFDVPLPAIAEEEEAGPSRSRVGSRRLICSS